MNRRGKEEISLEYLVRKAKKGDSQAFIELIEASKQSMLNIMRQTSIKCPRRRKKCSTQCLTRILSLRLRR